MAKWPLSVIDDHHGRFVADAALFHRPLEPLRRRDLGFDLVVRVGDVRCPIHEDRTRDVTGKILIGCRDVIGHLLAAAEIAGIDIAADVDDAQTVGAEMMLQPLRGHERVFEMNH